MKIKDFGVEIWMGLYENDCEYNLAETCVESFTVNQLLDFTDSKDEAIKKMLDAKLDYGAIEGSVRLRKGIAELYKEKKVENITITHGAIGANALTIMTLVEPGDRVISLVPTYQQHYSMPESIGAEVKIVKLKAENNFLPDLNELKSYVNENTKLICICNPNNPTGSLMDENFLKEIVKIAKSVDAYILSDEAYRGLNHEGDSFAPSIADLYEKGISTGSMSKTFSMAGVRIGWVAAPTEVIEAINKQRDYHIISCGVLDDMLATIGIENKEKIIKRNIDIVRNNIDMLDKWVQKEPLITYVKPKGGTTALLKYDIDITSKELCLRLLEQKGVMLLPGSELGMEGYLRIGFANTPSIVREGLEKFSEFLVQFKK